MPLLFSYGTLQQENVQQALFGRTLKGSSETLPGFQVRELEITDAQVIKTSGKRFHPILCFTGNHQDAVSGTAFELSQEELLQADRYEVNDYQRKLATLASGKQAFIYTKAAN